MVIEDPVAYKIKEYKDYLDKKEEVETSINSSAKQWFKFTKKQIIFQVIIGIAILIIGGYGIKQRTTIKSKASNLDQTGIYFVDNNNQLLTETHAATAKLRVVFVPPENGKIYKDKGDNKFYVVQGGLLHFLPLTSLINRYGGSGNIREVEHNVIEQWPIGEPIALPSPSPTPTPTPAPTAPPASDPNAVNYHLERNWNSFGIPIYLSAALTPEHFLKDVTQNKCDVIIGFDAASGQARAYYTDPNRAILNSMTAIEGGKGYTVNCPNGPVDFQLSGAPNNNNPQVMNGWSKVAMPRNINKNARTLLTELSNSSLSCDIIQKIRDGGTGGSDDTELFRISDSGNGFNLSDTKGYDIHCITLTSTPAPTPSPTPTPVPTPAPTSLPSVSYSSAFSSTQGQNNLNYLGLVKASNEYKNAVWDGSKWNVDGADRNFRIDSSSLAPSWNITSVIRWAAQQSGSITINGFFTRCCIEAGDAISPHTIYFVKKNSDTLWTQNTDDQTPRSFNLNTTVSSGDKIEFWVDANNDSGWDVSSINFNITYNTLGVSVARAQEAAQTAYPTHFKIGRNALELAQAQPQVFTPTANPGGIGVKQDLDVTLIRGANNYLVKFIFGTEEKPVLSTSALTYTPCAQAQSCPTTCHKDPVTVPDGQCGQTPCPGNAPQAQSCPTICHKDPVNVPDGQCGQTPCPGNAPQRQDCPTACGRPAGTVPDGNCSTTPCSATRSCLDINANGSIDLPDISLYISRGGVDLNGDGTANGTDYNQLYQAWVSGGRQR